MTTRISAPIAVRSSASLRCWLLSSGIAVAALAGATQASAQAPGALPQAAPAPLKDWEKTGDFKSPLVTADSVDPLYTQPFIDIDEWRDAPVRHRYVHGGFKGTDLRFSFYFPEKAQYGGRFFQSLMPVSGNENAAQAVQNIQVSVENNPIGFAMRSGAYFVESNMGKTDMFPGDDPTIAGYRASAAAAKYARVVAAGMYGKHRTYGYVYGGSGGAFKTISAFENTKGIWDGAVPFIPGSPVSMPNVFTVQAHAMRILWPRMPQIVDALEPGGGGDMYAGLNDEERAALLEVTRMGFPPGAWFNYKRVAFGYTGVFASLIDNVIKYDPTYFEDFWTKPGYLGANPPASLTAARIHHDTAISGLVMPEEARKMGIPISMPASQTDKEITVPAALRISNLPKGDIRGAALILKSGGSAGRRLYVVGNAGDLVMVGFGEANFKALAAISVGDEVTIDNRDYLASQTYHRHQIPSSPDYKVWDQYKDKDGKPLYPQRAELVGPKFAYMGGGALQKGKFDGKMIIVAALLDEAAYPWQPDWYRTQVRHATGKSGDENFRLWFVDNAMHTNPVVVPGEPRPVISTHIVSYSGVLQQALLDVSAWVEKGVAPPSTTSYHVVDGQIAVPATAAERKGVQPVVVATVNGGVRAEVKVGETLNFAATIEAPPGTGRIVDARWDFEGAGDFPVAVPLDAATGERASVKTSYAFSKPGTYFPALIAASQRSGDLSSKYARPVNLSRVRVVVK